MKSTPAISERTPSQLSNLDVDGALGLEREERAKIPQMATRKNRPAAPTGDEMVGQSIDEQIRDRAYELYLERGQQDGFAERDWLDAELELLANR